MIFSKDNERREFNSLYKECDEIYHKIAVKQGISDSAFMIFYGIVELGNGCRQKDICGCFSISKQTINSSIRNLEKSGYIELKPAKGRDMEIFLTKDGHKFVEENILPVVEIERKSFEKMGEKDRKELIRLTREYLDILKAKANKFYGI